MQTALDHANDVVRDWGDLAFLFLSNYARAQEKVFGEDVTAAAKKWNLAAPPTDRAWGAIYRRAMNANIIAKTDETRLRANGSLAMVYKSLVFGKPA